MARGEIHIELAVSYADDPKVAALARWPKDARGARDLYVQMICYAKQSLTDGYVPAENLGKLAYPDSMKVAERQVAMLADVGLIERAVNGWSIVAFLKRNKSKAEVRELSEIRSNAGRQGGFRSGEVRTSRSQPEANGKQVASVGLNTETETETSTTGPRKRGTRLPDDWTPTAADIEWQRSKRLTDDAARRETEKFRNYFESAPGQRGVKLDWSKTWRNWMLNSADRQPGRQQPTASSKPSWEA